MRTAAAKLPMSDKGFVLDASALLAVMFQEPGAERVEEVLLTATMSAVNLSEVIAKLYDRGLDDERVGQIVENLEVAVLPFDKRLAVDAGRLRAISRHLGLSLGDRACLATARTVDAIALTADRSWRELAQGVEVELFR